MGYRQFDAGQFDTRQFDTMTIRYATIRYNDINATVGCCHPKQAKYIAGENPVKWYINHHHEECLKNLVRYYFNRPIMEFFRGIAHHIGLD